MRRSYVRSLVTVQIIFFMVLHVGATLAVALNAVALSLAFRDSGDRIEGDLIEGDRIKGDRKGRPYGKYFNSE